MNPSTITSESRLASRQQIDNHIAAGRIEQARQLADAAVEEWCVPNSTTTVNSISALLSKIAKAVEDHTERLQLVTRAAELTLQLFGPDHPDAVFAALGLCDANVCLGDFNAADQHLSYGLSEIDRLRLQNTKLHSEALCLKSTLAIKLNRVQDAEVPAIKALKIRRKLQRYLWPHGLQVLSDAYVANGKASLAEAVLRKRQRHLDELAE